MPLALLHCCSVEHAVLTVHEVSWLLQLTRAALRLQGGLFVANCANLNLHGPATLTYATAALGFTQARPCRLPQAQQSCLPSSAESKQADCKCCLQGSITFVSTPNSAGQIAIILTIDAGYPTSTILGSGVSKLGS